MRYWSEDESSRRRRQRMVKQDRRRIRPRSKKKASVATGGSLTRYPFLREIYRHQSSFGWRVQRIALLLLAAGAIYAFAFGDGGGIRILTLMQERSALDTQLAQLNSQAEALAAEVEQLRNDEFHIEKVAREKYGFARPDETVYKLIPAPEDKK